MRFPSFALVLGLSLLAVPASARIYKCVASDGNVMFVSDPDDCVDGAVAPHRSQGAFHAIEARPDPVPEPAATATPAAPEAAPPTPPAATAPAPVPEESEPARWKRKRVDAERELARLEANIGEWGKIATWCSRGGRLAVEDEVGSAQPYDCTQALEAHAQMTARHEELVHYLDQGLQDECRQAECLPGWLR